MKGSRTVRTVVRLNDPLDAMSSTARSAGRCMQLGMIGSEDILVQHGGTLLARFASHEDADYSNHLLSVGRKQLSGHDEEAP